MGVWVRRAPRAHTPSIPTSHLDVSIGKTEHNNWILRKLFMEIIGDAEGLKREILEMARREGAGIISAAGDEAARILAAAGEEAAKAGAALLEAARVEAARRRAMLLASVPAETARLRGARLESLLGSIRTEAARLLPSEAAASGKAGLLAA